MGLRSILLILVIFSHNCFCLEHRQDILLRGESAHLIPIGESDFRNNISSKLSQDRDTRTLMYPLRQSLEVDVREILNILSNEIVDDAQKIQELRALVTQAKPRLMREIQDQLNPAELIEILSRDTVTAQEISEHLKTIKKTEESIAQKVQTMSMLKYFSPFVAEDEAPADLLDFPVFSTVHSDKIKKIEAHLKSNKLENLDDFARIVDREIFQSTDKRVLGTALLFSLFGLVPSSPSCGYLMDNVATFLRIPPDHASATGLISYILIATTPAFARQFYDMGKSITSSLFQKASFQGAKHESGIKPKHFEKNIAHKAVNTLLTGNAFITALLPTLLMKRSEIQFPLFFGLSVAPFFVAWFENAIEGGFENSDRLFRRYFYSTVRAESIKGTLRQELKNFLAEAKSNKELAKSVSQKIEDGRKKGLLGTKGDPFLFSCFFVKSKIQSENDPSGLTISKQVMSKDVALWSSTLLTGLGSYGRYLLFQSVFEELIGGMGFSPQWTTAISVTLSLAETLYRNACSHAQEEFFLKGTQLFSSEKNLTILRKTASVLSYISGILFSLPSLVAGLEILKNYTLTDKIVILAPAFLLEYSSYQPFFEKLYVKLLMDVAILPTGSYANHLAKIVHFSERVDNFIIHADVLTTETLWRVLNAQKTVT
ncbi:MAG: hypothetical protein ACOH2E_07700 [Candidatus Paracaedibacter sp.]